MKTNNGSGDTGKPGTISDEDVSNYDVIFHGFGTTGKSSAYIGVAMHKAHRCLRRPE